MPIRRISLSRRSAPCPGCGQPSRRHASRRRRLREIGITGPTVLVATYSVHYCKACRRHFSLSMEHLAPAHGWFTHRVRRVAVAMVVCDRLTLERASRLLQARYFVRVAPTTLHEWVTEGLAASA